MAKNTSGMRARKQQHHQNMEHDGPVKTKQKTRTKTADQSSGPPFHWDLWFLLALDNWILDFGRPIVARAVPLAWSPLDKPSVSDYFHMAYNVITPFCLLQLMDRTKRVVSPTIVFLSVIFFVMGTSIHLVADSINNRLIPLGFKDHLSLKENLIMQNMTPKELIHSFELLYRYDEEIGHHMWYIPFFLIIFFYFLGCFSPKPIKTKISITWILLVVISGVHFWYVATEGQIFPVFLFTYIAMLCATVYKKSRGQTRDINGSFLVWTFSLSIVLTAAWSIWLWNDKILRQKYPGLLYIPEPWAFYSLYIA